MVNDQITDSVTQVRVVCDKMKRAMLYLGRNWVFAKNSTYDAKKRDHSRICKTLAPVMIKGLVEGRL